MIPIFSDSRRTRLPHVYNGYTLNQEIGTGHKDIVEVNSVRVQTQVQHTREARERDSGLEVYDAFKRGKLLLVQGVVRASSWGALYDRIEEMAAAFDPDTVNRDNPDTHGFLPYDFNLPTADTANFPTGLMPCRYYVRAEEAFEPPLSQYAGLAVPFNLPLLAADPRRYLQDESSAVITSAGTAVDNGIATFYSWPTLSIAMAGAGNAAYSITDGDKTLVLDLSGRSAGQTVTVDMQNRRIEVDGSLNMALYVSGDYFSLDPGTTTVTVANATNTTSTLSWRPAFSA